MLATGDSAAYADVHRWRDVVAVVAGSYHTVGLTGHGRVIATGDNRDGQCDVSGWREVVTVAAGSRHTLGLCADGTVLAGCNDDGQCDVAGWAGMAVS